MPGLLLVVAALVQVSIVERIDLAGATPDLVTLVVVSLALLRGAISGAVGGFAAGLLVEAAAGDPLGPHALVLTVVGYACGRIGEQLVTDEHPVPPLVAAFVASLFVAWGVPVVQFLVGASDGGNGVVVEGLVTALLALVIATPVYLAIRALVGGSRVLGTELPASPAAAATTATGTPGGVA
jgi:rod shape-determining protein MreD